MRALKCETFHNASLPADLEDLEDPEIPVFLVNLVDLVHLAGLEDPEM